VYPFLSIKNKTKKRQWLAISCGKTAGWAAGVVNNGLLMLVNGYTVFMPSARVQNSVVGTPNHVAQKTILKFVLL
jgi:hypothetical protein